MSGFDLIVRGGTVITPKGAEQLDIGVTDGVIAELGVALDTGREEIGATGMHVLPGTIDVHFHTNDPGRAEWEGVGFATAGLAAGGTTTVLEMPLNAHPPTVDLTSWEAKLAVWKPRARVDFGLWGGIVPGKINALAELAEAGAIGFKAFMLDSGTDDFCAVDDADLYAAMEIAARYELPVAVHAENSALIAAGTRVLSAAPVRGAREYLASRPVIAELEAVSRALTLAGEAGCAIHLVHLSTTAAVRLVADARARGVDASCETCPHYLLFDVEDVERIGILAKCAPPIRERTQRERLWDAVRAGDIDLVSSDHSPAPAELKRGDFLTAWGGISGGQLLSSIVLSEGFFKRGIELPRLVELLGGAPARRFALAAKGRIEPGADADLTLVDLAGELLVGPDTLQHRHPTLTPYLGQHLRGRIIRTLLRGITIGIEGRPVGDAHGRLVRPSRAQTDDASSSDAGELLAASWHPART